MSAQSYHGDGPHLGFVFPAEVTVDGHVEPVQIEIEELDGYAVKLRIRRSGTNDVRIDAIGRQYVRHWLIRTAAEIKD